MNQIIFLSIFFIIYVAGNYYVYLKGQKALCQNCLLPKILYCVCFLLFSLAFPVAILERNTLPLTLLKLLYFVGCSWLGVCFFLVVLFALLSIVLKANTIKIQVFGAYALALTLSCYGLWRFNHPKIVEQEIVIAKQAGNLHELTVVGISDLHLGMGLDKGWLKRKVEMINTQKPDLVLLAGDLIDNTIRPLVEERMYEELLHITAPMGVYACTGNHEYMGSGMDKCRDFFRQANINLLEDTTVIVDSSLCIIGRNDIKGSPHRKPLSDIVSLINKSLPIILLDHEPHHLEEAELNGIDLQFSGHTHNGQIFPINLIVKSIYEIGHGYGRRGQTHYFVSSGLGIWGPLFRIGTDSELVVFKIRFSSE
ncbi:MAG: metallophosphoesterase [Dysgonamonadaceae bacterium]|jgi:predicted MPP superfamily phosphohydrolase|nr:metallophosphoesterase [Dysgonamonadaceae bacterium]